MSNFPLVSIIIPAYNHSAYVIEALNSVIADTYPNKEIIIIDDGSSDCTADLIQDWIFLHKNDLKIVFKSRENKGVTTTLNELIFISEGKYIVPLASDDMLVNNTILDRVNYLERCGDKLVLLSDARVIDSKGDILFKSAMSDFHGKNKNLYKSENEIIDEIVFNFTISGCVLMINRRIYDFIGEYPKDLIAEDMYFYIRSAVLGKIEFYDIIVSHYRLHTTNTSGYNPKLLKTVYKTYLRTFVIIPGAKRKLRVLKRLIWLFYMTFLRK